jgi:carbamoylphosphate synthase large subunit
MSSVTAMRILLTNAHRNVGFLITRHLGAAGHEVIAADSRGLPFGFRSRYARDFQLLPDPLAADFADNLLAVLRRRRPDVLIPLGGLAAISARRDEFERETAVLVADGSAYEAMIDKAHVYELCAQFGIPHPRVLGTDPDTVRARLPVTGDGSPLAAIKPRRDQGAGRGLVFVYDEQQVAERWPALTAQFGPLVGTDYVPGPVDAQNALHLLFDRDSELIEFFVLRKLRQWPLRTGITVAATSTHELELVEQMLPLFRHLRWRGPVEVELKRDGRTGRACVLEINPRFSGTLPFALAAGVDLPISMVNASLGRSSPRTLQPCYAAGLYYWNPLPYARSVLGDLVRADGFRRGLSDLAFPFAHRPVGNPYRLSDPAALAGKVLLQMAEAYSRRRAALGRTRP